MPTYEYECGRCGNRFERFQSMTEPPVKRCPKCRGGVRRVLGTGAGIIFKGSGFYATDYRSSGYRDAAKKESSGESSAKTKSESSGGSSDAGKKKTDSATSKE